MERAHQFMQKYMKQLTTTNYNQIEITFGTSIGKNIFNANISKEVFQKLKSYFEDVEQSTTQYLENKVYYASNKELHINNSFQQRVYNMKLYDHLLISKKENMPFDLKYTFSEKKMVSIEHFPTRREYSNEVFKKVTSVNIKNKFYVNFNEIEQTTGKTIYILTMLVKRRTNNRHNELHSMMLNFIEQVQSIANMFSSKENK